MESALEGKLEDLRRNLGAMGRVLLCLSGGVDSSLLARVARDVLGDGAIALTTVSPTNPEEDTSDASALARDLGLVHRVIDVDELEIPGYRANPLDRCYHCKTNLYDIARREADALGIERIVDGVNTEDLADYRPGLRAAAERDVRHPLAEAGLTKEEIRSLSRELGLRTWDRPASPCLSSRFPYGTEITHAGLDRVARGERILRDLGVAECRVRYHDPIARLEVPPAELERLSRSPLRERLVDAFRSLGFRYVTLDLEGFRSGSLNRGLEVSEGAPEPGRDPRAR